MPVDSAISGLLDALAHSGRAVLTAPPGSGKTTRIPLALLNDSGISGSILVLEPRRLAARSAAAYMARLLGEETGQTVGYRVRLDSKVSSRTRIELLTEGILTRRLIADPELTGVSCIIFDEFHERSLQADLGLALVLEAMEALRPDLKLLVMSATLDVAPLAKLLGDCPVIRAEGRAWPVDIRYMEGNRAWSRQIPDPAELTEKTVLAVHQALKEEDGGILVFLPGTGEIRRMAEALGTPAPGVSVHPLYGDLTLREQDVAIAPAPSGCRKIVLATSIAETSLTIEGVRVVIDCGLARTLRFDPATGLSRMVTERVSQAGADQRAGRAGRTQAGVCLRLWPQGSPLRPHPRPEIFEADLCPMLLDILAWGADPAELAWLTPPPAAALAVAGETLLRLNAAETSPLAASDRLAATPHGQALARLPLHPRLAHMLLRAAEHTPPQTMASLAASLATLVSERDIQRKSAAGPPTADIRPRLQAVGKPAHARLRETARQVLRRSGLNVEFSLPGADSEDFSGPLLSMAWPEWIAARRQTGSFRLASGQGASLPPHDSLANAPFLAVASLTAPQKGLNADARIHLAAPLSLDDIRTLHAPRIRHEEEIFWDTRNDAVACRRVERLEALILEEKALPSASPGQKERVQAAVVEGLLALGPGCLPWTDDLRQWQKRVFLLRNLEGNAYPWPEVDDEALFASLAANPADNWLTPWLDGITRRTHFSGIDLAAALAALLPWPLPARLEAEAPRHIRVPSGSEVRIDYLPKAGPILPVKLQEMFGQTQSPTIASGRIALTIHLLSPAGRPLQITSDLAHFWSQGYPAVRSEMRGRYPKHPWPEDPLNALPTRKVKNRL